MLAKTVAVGLLLGVAGSWGAGDGPLDRETLRGLKTLNIIVEPVSPELEQEGLKTADLRDLLEEALRQSDIAVDANATEFVGLRITSAQGKVGLRTAVAISLSLGVYQPVILVRSKETRTATDTWGTQSVILAPPKQVQKSVEETVDVLVKQLADAYRSVNPR